MHRIHKRKYVINGRARQYAVSEIEYVPGATGSLFQNLYGAAANFGRWSEECNRVKVALHRHVVSKPCPCFFEVYTPVKSNDIASCLFHQIKQSGGIGAKVYDRPPRREAANKPIHMWQYKLAVVIWRKTAYPTIKELYCIRASGDLPIEIRGGCLS